MKILKSSQIKEVDEFTIQNEPIESIDLMERASLQITNWIQNNISLERKIKLFIGPGNNGGDGLAIAHQLYAKHYKVKVYILKITDKFSTDAQKNLNRLKEIPEIPIENIISSGDFPVIDIDDTILDGLFGSGLTRKLEGLSKELVNHINKSKARIISIDMPSGLFGEDNTNNDKEAIIKASSTLSFQMPKLSFLFSENNKYVGNWEILPIGLNQEKIIVRF